MFFITPISIQGPWSIEKVIYEYEGLNAEYDARLYEYLLAHSQEISGTYTALRHDTRGVVDVNTPWTKLSYKGILGVLTGRVLLGGLRSGYFLDEVINAKLVFKNIKEIVVLESDKDLIDLVSPRFKNNKKIKIIHDDPQKCDPKKYGHFNVGWFDLWDTDNCTDIFSRIETLVKWESSCDLLDAWRQDWVVFEAVRLGLISG